jgi:hypothetical protein
MTDPQSEAANQSFTRSPAERVAHQVRHDVRPARAAAARRGDA